MRYMGGDEHLKGHIKGFNHLQDNDSIEEGRINELSPTSTTKGQFSWLSRQSQTTFNLW